MKLAKSLVFLCLFACACTKVKSDHQTTTDTSGGNNVQQTDSLPNCRLNASQTVIDAGSSVQLSFVPSGNATTSVLYDADGKTILLDLQGSKLITLAAPGTYSYSGTVSNSAGSTSCSVSIKVNALPAPTPTCALSLNPTTISSGISSTLTANITGTFTSISIVDQNGANVALDSMNKATVAPSVTTNYSGTVTYAGGSVACPQVTLTVDAAVTPPPPTNLQYSASSFTYTQNVALLSNPPTNSGGVIASYAVTPQLPQGLSINTSTGLISGTPTQITPSANYTITGTNVSGFTSVVISITVNDAAPTNLAYSKNPAVYTKNVAIAYNNPSNSGGAIVTYSVSPQLPQGLSLDTNTGVISGTPGAIASIANYTITGKNSGGTTYATLSIVVNDAPPANLVYSANPATYTNGVAITPNSPTSSGGAIVSYSVSTPLPQGLKLNSTNGVISGTPTAVMATANYTITASNSGGSTQVIVSITVNDAAPSNLVYSANPASFVEGVAIQPDTPKNSGGTITSYSISPGLPPGLSLDSTSGIISGTPLATASATNYTVTGSNSLGYTNVVISIAVTPSNAPMPFIVVSPDHAVTSESPESFVKVMDISGHLLFEFAPYPGYRGTILTAVGDVDGDGIPDIVTSQGYGVASTVKVFSGATGQQIYSFMPFASTFKGGASVAVGDVNADGYGDIIVGAGGGGSPAVKVYSGKDGSLLSSFLAYTSTFTGGVRVAAGDVAGAGYAQVITGPGPGDAPYVKIFNAMTPQLLKTITAYSTAFTSGVFVATGDYNGDGKPDVFVGQAASGLCPGDGFGGYSCYTKVFDYASGSLLHSEAFGSGSSPTGQRVGGIIPSSTGPFLVVGSGGALDDVWVSSATQYFDITAFDYNTFSTTLPKNIGVWASAGYGILPKAPSLPPTPGCLLVEELYDGNAAYYAPYLQGDIGLYTTAIKNPSSVTSVTWNVPGVAPTLTGAQTAAVQIVNLVIKNLPLPFWPWSYVDYLQEPNNKIPNNVSYSATVTGPGGSTSCALTTGTAPIQGTWSCQYNTDANNNLINVTLAIDSNGMLTRTSGQAPYVYDATTGTVGETWNPGSYTTIAPVHYGWKNYDASGAMLNAQAGWGNSVPTISTAQWQYSTCNDGGGFIGTDIDEYVNNIWLQWKDATHFNATEFNPCAGVGYYYNCTKQ